MSGRRREPRPAPRRKAFLIGRLTRGRGGGVGTAVGVSGGPPAEDEQVALAGITSVGFQTTP